MRKTPPGAAGKGLTATAMVAAALLLAGAADRAEAQLFPWGGWEGPAPWQAQPRRPRRIPRYVEPEDEKPTSTLPKPSGPLLLVVSLGRQTVTVYDGVNKIATSPISSGQRGLETPTGIFSLLEKNRYHYSNLYGGAPMPFMQRVTNSGVAMHAGDLPGYPASHGCIRLPYSFARNLFGITDIGARVVVSDEDLAPAEFQSARLIAPLPPGDEDREKTGFSTMIGVTPAAAEGAAAADKPRTRGMAAAARAAERERLAAAITEAEEGKTAAIDQAKSAADAARAAKDDVRKARSEQGRLADAARKAAKDAANAESRFADLTRNMAKVEVEKLDPVELEKQAANELAEETKVLDLADAVVPAKALAAKQADAVTKAVADAEAAETARRAASEGVTKAGQALVDAKAALAAAEAIEARKDYPVSIFVSSKTGRLFAKLGFEKVIDVPVTIADPGKPLGTHVLTATAFTDGEASMRWTAVTVNAALTRPQPPRRKRRHEDEVYVAPAGEEADAASALERIEIPEETKEQLAELMKPGSSFIISDYALSRETSNRTEFIVEPWRARRHEEYREFRYE